LRDPHRKVRASRPPPEHWPPIVPKVIHATPVRAVPARLLCAPRVTASTGPPESARRRRTPVACQRCDRRL